MIHFAVVRRRHVVHIMLQYKVIYHSLPTSIWMQLHFKDRVAEGYLIVKCKRGQLFVVLPRKRLVC